MLGDPFIVVQPQRPYREEVDAPTGKLRIAWTTNSWRPDVPVDMEVVGCIEEVANECQRMGHEVSEVSPIFDYEEYLIAFSNAISLGFDVGIDTLSAILHRPVSKETLEPVTLSYYHYAKGLTSKDLARTDELLNKIRRTFGAFFQKYDLLLTPTLSLLPQPIGKYALSRSDLEFVEYNRLTDEINMHTAPVNIIGYPAISLPLGQSKSGLPIGAQFIARFGDEATLIRLASAFEHEMPWLDRIPPVHVSR
jgi:amidase